MECQRTLCKEYSTKNDLVDKPMSFKMMINQMNKLVNNVSRLIMSCNRCQYKKCLPTITYMKKLEKSIHRFGVESSIEFHHI